MDGYNWYQSGRFSELAVTVDLSMAEGTRLKTMDERLGLHDIKLEEINEGLSKTRKEFTHKFEGIEGSIAELKQMLIGLHSSKKDEGSVVIQIEENSEGALGNSANKSPSSGNITSPSSTVMSNVSVGTSIPPHSYVQTQHPSAMNNYTAYTVPFPSNSTNNQHYYSTTPYYSTTTATPNSTMFANHNRPVSNMNLNHQLYIPPNQFSHHNHTPPYTHPSHNPPISTNSHARYESQPFNPIPKIEFPKFSGADPKSWVIRAEQYFEFIPMDDNRKVKLSGLHFEGRASVWFRFYQVGRTNSNWKAFQADVVARFEIVETMDVQDQFNKIKQTGTIADYEDKFEELRALVLSKNRGFNEEYFISSFISGLKDNIKGSVKMFRPQSLSDAVYLAKQEEN